ncbi:hypothetical protein D9Q98_000664 [Chlorella vulgaris]|uniref:Coenzyme Q-binding protein COQ10 START domain-containing protein n=1 Tax=Chlorella vulgaris TaxID=3077 RepID=A0A9D4TYT8_CHLVU|nr:hypothetical protein D9Q98_000664 [Chlorella vulgaris]
MTSMSVERPLFLQQRIQRNACTKATVPALVVLHRRRLRGSAVRATAAATALGGRRLRGPHNGSKWTCSQWLENNAQVDCDVPLEDAFALWEDRERIPVWMPWITSVKVQADDPRMSRWTLSTFQFNRQWEFSWLALNMTPLKNQKIHWRSVPGTVGGSLGSGLEVANSGQIRFARKGEGRCTVKLTISYEVPSVLAPFASLLRPVVEGILQTDMRRFAEYAVQQQQGRSATA